jgi:thiol-disulfide isomerase/thioredoxin
MSHRPRSTAVPSRGAKRKPNQPPSKRTSGAAPPGAGNRPADNRRIGLAQKRRRNQTLLAFFAIAAIIAVVGVFIAIKVSGGTGTKTNTATVPVADSTLARLTNGVSLKEMQAAADNFPLRSVAGEGSTYPTVTSDTPITTTGKPELLYIGAEFCPYCATERWPLVLALSKFGTFHNLSTIHSAGGDEVYPDTPTFSFYKSTYTSPYLTFTPVEEETITHGVLQNPTAAQQAIVDKYDTSNDIPFIYFNGKAIIDDAEYNPALLGSQEYGPASKRTFQQIAKTITAQNSALASNVTADAGVIVSMICRMTGGKPAAVCRLFPKPITNPS